MKIQIFFFISSENSNVKNTNELKIDVLKSDVKQLQEEIQTITKVLSFDLKMKIYF